MKKNGTDCDVSVFGSTLSTDALRILASITPEELRAYAKRIGCLYGGKDEAEAMRCGKKLDRAARVA